MPLRLNRSMVLLAAAVTLAAACSSNGSDPTTTSTFPRGDAGPDGSEGPAPGISRPDDDGGAPQSDAPVGPTTCATTTAKATIADIDLYVMLDRSTSMLTGGRWAAVVSAVSNVAYDSRFAGMGMALQYFPLLATCRVSDYAKPDVPMETLPKHSAKVVTSITGNEPFGESPMVPALSGAVDYAKAWQAAHPERTTIVVLASDGLPDNTCQTVPDGGVVNNLAGMIQVATDAANATPPIRTFVIGVGDALTGLNQIAAAGGSEKAIFVDTSAGVEAQFIDALNKVRKQALACDYVIPPPTGGKIDFSKVNVKFSPNGGQPAEDFIYVGALANCGLAAGARGWYYDDATAATRVLLCPDSCAKAKASNTGQLDLLFGCETKAAPSVPPPPPPK